MRQNQNLISDRIDSFLSNPNAGTLTGERRMSTKLLLDLLAGHIEKDSSANVIRIKEKKNLLDYIISNIIEGKRNHILLYVDVDPKKSDLIVTMFPGAHIYRAKELCHQVPVCFKVSDSDLNGIANCTGPP